MFAAVIAWFRRRDKRLRPPQAAGKACGYRDWLWLPALAGYEGAAKTIAGSKLPTGTSLSSLRCLVNPRSGKRYVLYRLPGRYDVLYANFVN